MVPPTDLQPSINVETTRYRRRSSGYCSWCGSVTFEMLGEVVPLWTECTDVMLPDGHPLPHRLHQLKERWFIFFHFHCREIASCACRLCDRRFHSSHEAPIVQEKSYQSVSFDLLFHGLGADWPVILNSGTYTPITLSTWPSPLK